MGEGAQYVSAARHGQQHWAGHDESVHGGIHAAVARGRVHGDLCERELSTFGCCEGVLE